MERCNWWEAGLQGFSQSMHHAFPAATLATPFLCEREGWWNLNAHSSALTDYGPACTSRRLTIGARRCNAGIQYVLWSSAAAKLACQPQLDPENQP